MTELKKVIHYGNNRTIHGTNHLDVEVDKDGKVVAVWFRCMMLPFKQTNVGDDRADDMRRASINSKIHAVDVELE